ncbi:MAG: hypothetical protein J6Z45_01760 [Oscillospiraceae bacterium]|nr:hypothetical protein [Oscillospiraceae bacterium]
MELFRPLPAEEFRQIEANGFASFPARSSGQQLFTALLSHEGAAEIARRMRIEKQAEHTVYVVGFLVEDAYIRQFSVQNSDQPERSALWIPAEEIDILNQHLVGKIRMLDCFEIDRSDGDIFFA